MRRYGPGYCRTRYGQFSFNQFCIDFENLVGFQALSLRSKARLYSRICNARTNFDFWEVIDAEPAPTAVAREIAEIMKSIERIAAFGRLAFKDEIKRETNVAAIESMTSALERWAAQQKRDELPSYFHPSRFENDGTTGMYYDSYMVLRSFFHIAEIIRPNVVVAKKELSQKNPRPRGMTAIQWLAGKQLPMIYQMTFPKKKFSFTVSEAGHSDGIEFVITSLAAIGVTPKGGTRFQANTIKSHFRAANKYGSD